MSYLEIAKRTLEAKRSQERTESHGGYSQVPALVPGAFIEWRSPLFGLCQGKVSLIDGDKILIDLHPITKDPAWISLEWVSRILN